MNKNNPYYNNEGYADPTAFYGTKQIVKEEAETERRLLVGLPGFITVAVVKAAFLMNGLHRFPVKTGSRGCVINLKVNFQN